nr:MAG: coat protein [Cnidium polerovirus 1]
MRYGFTEADLKQIKPRRARRSRRRVRVIRPKPVVVVQTNQPRRRRGRRGRGNRRSSGGIQRSGGFRHQLVFSKDDLKGNSSGIIKFGPDLAEHQAFCKGLLNAYHQYKITNVRVQYKSEAASTLSGSIAYELDPSCKLTTLESKLRKFPITRNASASWSAREINGEVWQNSTENQFFFLYKGNGDSGVAGSLLISYNVLVQNAKQK